MIIGAAECTVIHYCLLDIVQRGGRSAVRNNSCILKVCYIVTGITFTEIIVVCGSGICGGIGQTALIAGIGPVGKREHSEKTVAADFKCTVAAYWFRAVTGGIAERVNLVLVEIVGKLQLREILQTPAILVEGSLCR